ncbi:hypothetical protein D9M71_766410 [compost metagenome]
MPTVRINFVDFEKVANLPIPPVLHIRQNVNGWPPAQHKPLTRQPFDQCRALIGQSLKLIVDCVDAVADGARVSRHDELRAFLEGFAIRKNRTLPFPVGAGNDG